MTIREYINKNLTHLNWNILPQIFESEGVELTEEIERYLRETPKNTNWNVFGSLENNGKQIILFEGEVICKDYDQIVLADVELLKASPNVGDIFRVTTDVGVIDGTITAISATGYDVNYPPINVDMYAQIYDTTVITFQISKPTKITKVELITQN